VWYLIVIGFPLSSLSMAIVAYVLSCGPEYLITTSVVSGLGNGQSQKYGIARQTEHV